MRGGIERRRVAYLAKRISGYTVKGIAEHFRRSSVYVNDENKIVYMPLGLDVFDKLAKACDNIKSMLTSEKEKLISGLETLPFGYEGTIAGDWYSSITRKTKDEEVNSDTTFREEKGKRLEELHKILIEDSKKKRAIELRTKKERYEQLETRLEGINTGLSNEKIKSLKDAKSTFETAAAASRLASKTAFETEPLKGVGSDAWRELWTAAKIYSEAEAYPGIEFPNTGPDSKCVLCFQDLGKDAKERLNKFKAFIQDETAKNERKAKQAFDTEKANLEKIQISKDNDETLLKELKEDNAFLEATIREFLKSVTNRKDLSAKASEDGLWEKITELPENPSDKVKQLCDAMESNATALEQADDPEILKKLQTEFKEHSARKWVSERKHSIIKEINRQKLVKKYEEAITEVNTRPVTIMSNQLTETYVTEELKKRFLERLNSIYGQLNVALEKKEGEKGSTYYYVKLKDCTIPRIETSEIISEGESKAVALAEFLAEISCSPTKSGVIFDDPVSSLDHLIRENVAKEFVELAKDRQVVVFTHDLFFLVTLREIANKKNIPVNGMEIFRNFTGTGICKPEVPWEAMSTQKRIGELNKLLQEANSKYIKGDADYELHADSLCKKIRQTVERAIEEILLLGMVERYRRNIQTTKIAKLTKITKEDCEFLVGLMTEYSKYLHDQEEVARVPLPKPDKLKEDIKKLDEWVKEFNYR